MRSPIVVAVVGVSLVGALILVLRMRIAIAVRICSRSVFYLVFDHVFSEFGDEGLHKFGVLEVAGDVVEQQAELTHEPVYGLLVVGALLFIGV